MAYDMVTLYADKQRKMLAKTQGVGGGLISQKPVAGVTAPYQSAQQRIDSGENPLTAIPGGFAGSIGNALTRATSMPTATQDQPVTIASMSRDAWNAIPQPTAGDFAKAEQERYAPRTPFWQATPQQPAGSIRPTAPPGTTTVANKLPTMPVASTTTWEQPASAGIAAPPPTPLATSPVSSGIAAQMPPSTPTYDGSGVVPGQAENSYDIAANLARQRVAAGDQGSTSFATDQQLADRASGQTAQDMARINRNAAMDRPDAMTTANPVEKPYTMATYAVPRALGGPVEPNKPYLVGEQGPELIVPKQPGYVVPNQDNMVMAGGQMRQRGTQGIDYGGPVPSLWAVGSSGPQVQQATTAQPDYAMKPTASIADLPVAPTRQDIYSRRTGFGGDNYGYFWTEKDKIQAAVDKEFAGQQDIYNKTQANQTELQKQTIASNLALQGHKYAADSHKYAADQGLAGHQVNADATMRSTLAKVLYDQQVEAGKASRESAKETQAQKAATLKELQGIRSTAASKYFADLMKQNEGQQDPTKVLTAQQAQALAEQMADEHLKQNFGAALGILAPQKVSATDKKVSQVKILDQIKALDPKAPNYQQQYEGLHALLKQYQA